VVGDGDSGDDEWLARRSEGKSVQKASCCRICLFGDEVASGEDFVIAILRFCSVSNFLTVSSTPIVSRRFSQSQLTSQMAIGESTFSQFGPSL